MESEQIKNLLNIKLNLKSDLIDQIFKSRKNNYRKLIREAKYAYYNKFTSTSNN